MTSPRRITRRRLLAAGTIVPAAVSASALRAVALPHQDDLHTLPTATSTTTFRTVSELKAAPTEPGKSTYDGSTWLWTPGDFSAAQPDELDENVVASNAMPLSSGAWLRLAAKNIAFTPWPDTRSQRDVQGKLRELVSIKDFGAIGDGRPNLLSERFTTLSDAKTVFPRATRLTQSVDYCAAMAGQAALVAVGGGTLHWPTGNYFMSDMPQLGAARVCHIGIGRVVIQAGFDGSAVVSLDVGDDTIAYQGIFANFVLRGNGSPNQSGLYVRNLIHARRSNLRVRNVTENAFHISGDVLSEYEHCLFSPVDEGTDSEAIPKRGLLIEGSQRISSTTACTFGFFTIEAAVEHGILLRRASDCNFNYGAAEGLIGWGVTIGNNCQSNTFNRYYCESNAIGDFNVYGKSTTFVACEAYSKTLNTPSFKIRNGARNTLIKDGGSDNTIIEIDKGALFTNISNYEAYKISDAGTKTIMNNYRERFESDDYVGGRSFGNTASGRPDILSWYEEFSSSHESPNIRLYIGTKDGVAIDDHGQGSGRAVRIGSRVLGDGRVVPINTNGLSEQNLSIHGFPFACAPSHDVPLNLGCVDAFNMIDRARYIHAILVAGTSRADIYYYSEIDTARGISTSGMRPLTVADVIIGKAICFSFDYSVR